MALFKINNNIVKKILTKDLDLEKNLQGLFENNLEEILNIVFLAHEYSTSFGGRIDTLGIDRTGAPCIIEYKKNQNDNVINQGLSYLRWLLDHKADFEILCQNKKIDIDIDWDSPRVICIAESYNKFDLDTADILPINVELLRYRIYEDNILYIEPENYQKVKISMSGIVRKTKQDKDKQEKLQKTFSIEDHLKKSDEKTKKLFYKLREKIVALDENIREEPKKQYIAYKVSTNFADVILYRSEIRITLNVKTGQLNDPQNITTDFTKPKKGHWGNGDYEVKLEDDKELDAVFELVKQSYDLNK
ncbi:transporter [Candidatus Nomurabacteria bacterium]|nr:transporter [Candidatus Nomurabacteria bacterium]